VGFRPIGDEREIIDAEVIEERPRARGFRPLVPNPDGSVSTERTIGIEADGQHFNIPTLVGGRQLSDDEAVTEWRAGRNPEVGRFASRGEADAAAPVRSSLIGQQIRATNLAQAPDVPRGTLAEVAKGVLRYTTLGGMAYTGAEKLYDRARRSRLGVMAEDMTPAEMDAAEARDKTARGRPRTPGAVVGPTPASFEPEGASSVSAQVGPAIKATGQTLLGGGARMLAEGYGAMGVPGMDPIAQRGAELARRAEKRRQMVEARLPAPIADVPAPDRLTAIGRAVSEPRNVLAGVSQAAELAPAIAATVATRNPGIMLGAMRAMTAPREYHRYREEGLDVPLALAGAAMQAEAEAQPERIFTSAILKTPIGRLIRGNPSEFAQAVRYVARATGAEGVSEGLSTTFNWMSDKLLADPGATPERLIEELKQTAAQMAVQGPLMAGAARAARAVPDMARSAEERISPQTAIARALSEELDSTELRAPAAGETPLRLSREPLGDVPPSSYEPSLPETLRAQGLRGEEPALRSILPESLRPQGLREDGAGRESSLLPQSLREQALRVVADQPAAERLPAAESAAEEEDEPLRAVGTQQVSLDYYEPFKQATGKYPWEMPFEQFFKLTVSKLKKAAPGRDTRWYEGVIRSEWNKARDASPVGTEGLPDIDIEAITADVRAAIERAEQDQPEFESWVATLAGELGLGAVVAKVKKMEPALRKVTTDYRKLANPVSHLKDLNRATLVVDEPSQVEQILSRVNATGQSIKIDNLYGKPGHVGYRHGMTVLKTDRGYREIQINTPEMLEAKDHAHVIYEWQRELLRRLNEEGREASAEEGELLVALNRRMTAIYDAANLANRRRVQLGINYTGQELTDAAARARQRGKVGAAGEAERWATSLSKVGLSISKSPEAGLGGRSSLRGGEVSNASTTPRDQATRTGSPSKDQYSIPAGMARSLLQGEQDGIQAAEEDELRAVGTEGRRGGSSGRPDRQAGKLRTNPIASAELAVAVDRAYPPPKNRWGQCHTLTWRMVNYELGAPDQSKALHHVIGVTQGAPNASLKSIGVKVWHSVAYDPVAKVVWEPIAGRWYTPEAMTVAFGFEPVASLTAEESARHAMRSRVYTDQTVLELRGNDKVILQPGEYDAGSWPGENVPVGTEGARPREETKDQPAKPGDKILVLRVAKRPTLDDSNAGNADSLADHIARFDDVDRPSGPGLGQTIFAFEVTVPPNWGAYKASRNNETVMEPGRQDHYSGIAYSFPRATDAKLVAQVPLAKVRQRLKERFGFESFDDAGTIEGAKAIREELGLGEEASAVGTRGMAVTISANPVLDALNKLKPMKAPADQWIARLQRLGLRKIDLELSGVLDWLEMQKPQEAVYQESPAGIYIGNALAEDYLGSLTPDIAWSRVERVLQYVSDAAIETGAPAVLPTEVYRRAHAKLAELFKGASSREMDAVDRIITALGVEQAEFRGGSKTKVKDATPGNTLTLDEIKAVAEKGGLRLDEELSEDADSGRDDEEISNRAWELAGEHYTDEINREMPDRPKVVVTGNKGLVLRAESGPIADRATEPAGVAIAKLAPGVPRELADAVLQTLLDVMEEDNRTIVVPRHIEEAKDRLAEKYEGEDAGVLEALEQAMAVIEANRPLVVESENTEKPTFIARIIPGDEGRVREYPRGRRDRSTRGAYNWNFEAETLGPFDTHAEAQAAGIARVDELWIEEFDLRYEYATDETPDWAYEQAERELGGRPDPQSYNQYVVPGGDDYGYFFVTAPQMRGSWKDGHDEYNWAKNPVVRVRHDTREDAAGRRILFINEIQPPSKGHNSAFPKMPKWGQDHWGDIGVKYAIKYAIENGFDGVAITTGPQQEYIYRSSRALKGVNWVNPPYDSMGMAKREDSDNSHITIHGKNGETYGVSVKDGKIVRADGHLNKAAGKPLKELFGEKLANRMMNEQSGAVDSKEVDRSLLSKLGAIYDNVLPGVMARVLKKLDGPALGKVTFDTTNEGDAKALLKEQPGFLITPEMKKAIAERGIPIPKEGSDNLAKTAARHTVYPMARTPKEASARMREASFEKLGLKTGHPSALGFTSKTEINYNRMLSQTEQMAVADAIDQLVQDGALPLSVAQSVAFVGFSEFMPGAGSYTGLFWPGVNVVGISAKVLSRASTQSAQAKSEMLNYLAHELTHRVDFNATNDVNANRAIPKTASAASPRLAFQLMQPVLSVVTDKAKQQVAITGPIDIMGGDLIVEAIEAYNGAPRALRAYLDYPLIRFARGDFDANPGAMKIEITAQIGALYHTRPEIVRVYMPKWYAAMKEIYGDEEKGVAPPKSVDEAHARLRAALQVEGAGQPAARGFRSIERRPPAGEADRKVATRGPPETGVGEGEQRAVGAQGRGAAPGGAGGGPANPYWNFNEPGLIDALRREWQDNKIDLAHVQSAIERSAGVISEPANAYLAEERYHGRVATLLKRFGKRVVEPLLKEIRDSKVTIDEVGRYLWARHAPERNAQMAKINPAGSPANLSGLTDAEAATILRQFSAQGKSAALASIARRVDAITNATRAMLVARGLEDQSTIDNWTNAYKHYVPLFRDMDEPHTGQGFKVIGPESKRAMGSEREAVAILAAVIAQHERAMIRAEKADVGRSLIKLAEDFPNPDFWRVDQPPMKRSINPTTGLVQNTVDPQYRSRDDVFIVKQRVNGAVVERVLAFNPSSERAMKLAAAMKNLDVVQLGALTKAVGKVTRLIANLATSWNPVFWTTNFARDVQTAAVNLQSTPLQGRAPTVISNIPKAIAGIADAEFRNGTSRWAQIYREFEEQGGKTGWMSVFDDLVDRQAELTAEIKRSQRSMANPLKWLQISIETIDKVNSGIENATRLSAYYEARSMGISPAKAASIAKNLTVNFNRKGNRSSATNAWYMFFNANVQGTARLIKAIATSPKAAGMVGTLAAFGAAMELLNRLIGDRDRDEDENNPYELVAENIKQKNMVFMVPGSKGNYVLIPLPYGFNVFHNAGRMAMEAVLGASSDLVGEKKGPLEAGWNFAQVLLDSFMPLGHASTPGQLIAPSVLDPFVQFGENKTWFGAPMRPEPFFGQNEPDHKQYFRTTSDTAKDITKWLSDATGGDDVRGGSIDISPTTLSHIFGTLTGGTGRFGLGMFDFTKHVVGRVTGEAEAEDLPAQNVPFVGKFYGEITDRDRAAKFYRLREEALKTVKQVRAYRKLGEDDKADELEEKEPALTAMGREIMSSGFRKDLKGVRDEFKEVDRMPREERAATRRELSREEASVMSRAVREYNREQGR
jgi:hypothetical protein